jgi:hypothetical protein
MPASALAPEPTLIPAGNLRVVRPDKVASVACRAGLGAEVRVSVKSLVPKSGDLVVVKVLSENPAYDRIELTTGRQARISAGDLIVGALGSRRALKGYVGDVPPELSVGDELALLNMGGVIGRCTGFNQALGQPVRVAYVGAVVDGGAVANAADHALPRLDTAVHQVPVIAVAGSCMHAGKTRVASELVKQFTAAGYRVAAAKTSGIACLKDTLEMRDNGAVKTLSFLDLGLVSTVGLPDLSWVARSLINHLSADAPDVIILELGDGLIGGYNVGSVLGDADVRSAMAALIFCAGDFVSAWGGIELLRRQGLAPDVISGAVTDSRMGVEFVRRELGIPAANAMTGGSQLFALVETRLAALESP